ncbi:multiubiquitin domain-containing protein [Kribbella ginsengisoli]|uniref:Multi-ubiquitin domain-containing protein n=1 Tax=Kribbella ginsengisoli TaxID=363865 RepID=A0ABP6X1V4_9ACTN
MSPNGTNESGHGKPTVTIYVNTREFGWEQRAISYEQVYELAFPDQPLNDGDVARIEYSRGHSGRGAGTLHPGDTVNVKPKMVFDVYVTVRS